MELLFKPIFRPLIPPPELLTFKLISSPCGGLQPYGAQSLSCSFPKGLTCKIKDIKYIDNTFMIVIYCK